MSRAKKKDDPTAIPEFLKRRLTEHNEKHGKYIPRQYEDKFIRQREDGTKVYMYQLVEEAHRLMPDGTKVYEKSGTHREWVMPDYEKPIKRSDIHTTIDLEIFKAINSLKHAKKRPVIAAVREALLKSDVADKLPKNVGIAISRRIGILVEKRNLEYVQETKTRKVLREGKYKYVSGR